MSLADSHADLDQTANLLGALSQVIADRMADAMEQAGGRSGSGAAVDMQALRHGHLPRRARRLPRR